MARMETQQPRIAENAIIKFKYQIHSTRSIGKTRRLNNGSNEPNYEIFPLPRLSGRLRKFASRAIHQEKLPPDDLLFKFR